MTQETNLSVHPATMQRLRDYLLRLAAETGADEEALTKALDEVKVAGDLPKAVALLAQGELFVPKVYMQGAQPMPLFRLAIGLISGTADDSAMPQVIAVQINLQMLFPSQGDYNVLAYLMVDPEKAVVNLLSYIRLVDTPSVKSVYEEGPLEGFLRNIGNKEISDEIADLFYALLKSLSLDAASEAAGMCALAGREMGISDPSLLPLAPALIPQAVLLFELLDRMDGVPAEDPQSLSYKLMHMLQENLHRFIIGADMEPLFDDVPAHLELFMEISDDGNEVSALSANIHLQNDAGKTVYKVFLGVGYEDGSDVALESEGLRLYVGSNDDLFVNQLHASHLQVLQQPNNAAARAAFTRLLAALKPLCPASSDSEKTLQRATRMFAARFEPLDSPDNGPGDDNT